MKLPHSSDRWNNGADKPMGEGGVELHSEPERKKIVIPMYKSPSSFTSARALSPAAGS